MTAATVRFRHVWQYRLTVRLPLLYISQVEAKPEGGGPCHNLFLNANSYWPVIHALESRFYPPNNPALSYDNNSTPTHHRRCVA